MNLITFDRNQVLRDFGDGRCLVRLEDRAANHLRQVLRAELGQFLKVGEINGRIGHGQVVSMKDSKIDVEFSPIHPAPSPLPLRVILALPRPKTLPRILQTLTSLGVKDIDFINCWKVEKCYWSSDYLSESVLFNSCRLGLEQAVDTRLPNIQFHRLFKPYVEDIAPTYLRAVRGYVAHPYAKLKLSSKQNSPSVLVIGPEGGFIPYEIEKFSEAGYEIVQVGARILKLETAIPVLVSKFL